MVRPHKNRDELKTHQMISCNQDVKDFVEDHRGELDISHYWIEGVYKLGGGDVSREEKRKKEIEELKAENEELKKKLMFANTTIERLQKKSSPIIVYDPIKLENMRNELFEKSNRVGGIIISWDKGEINWPHFIEKYRFDNKTEAEAWLKNKIDKVKNNGAEV